VVEHYQELGLVGVQPLEQPIEGSEAGGAHEDAVEAGPHFAAAARRRRQAIRLEVGVEPPDQPADKLLGGALLVGEGLQLGPEGPSVRKRTSAYCTQCCG
jgi:hypothetical protein